MTTYYFVRHGQAEHTIAGVINDNPQKAIGLTVRGIVEANILREKLNDIDFDCAFVSPYPRTKEAANIILQDKNIPQVFDERLGEFRSGLDGQHSRVFYQVYKDKILPRALGCESFYDVLARLTSCIRDIEERNLMNVLIVTHGDILRAARCLFTNTSVFDEFQVKTPVNCDVLKYTLPIIRKKQKQWT
ncbi:MAG: histidine phosphatase family protein [Geobacteraceae bacterium]|nr:histidine phosphatase family protein [Geobacteraceae bacterium]